MAHFPKVHPSIRAPRTSFSRPEAANFRVEDRVVRGRLYKLSTTGGYVAFEDNVRGGSLAEIEIPTPLGRICGLIEFLSRKAGSGVSPGLAFRFVGMDEAHFERLRAALKRFG